MENNYEQKNVYKKKKVNGEWERESIPRGDLLFVEEVEAFSLGFVGSSGRREAITVREKKKKDTSEAVPSELYDINTKTLNLLFHFLPRVIYDDVPDNMAYLSLCFC